MFEILFDLTKVIVALITMSIKVIIERCYLVFILSRPRCVSKCSRLDCPIDL